MKNPFVCSTPPSPKNIYPITHPFGINRKIPALTLMVAEMRTRERDCWNTTTFSFPHEKMTTGYFFTFYTTESIIGE
jgi:hypothetical protein